MPTDDTTPPDAGADPATPEPGQRSLSPAARHALTEAAARHAERERREAPQAKEIAGRSGLEPTRYGDWEIKGLASDF